ncbi:hypothetical protein ITP53_54345 [Nonomuraea sp. K274]|uniref:Thiopeptide-type bacteriocin biosynthesis domain-containing protein n=1 Tax=Nonomuraea cypriaca TaxID=1187855 RepID=A0A931F400_9ACTN|nr:thiopeptide maturation pyridine synthase [Nonomuraea cypriaca]MBF8194494.1 hypothetical protein [Nonomuraea cypriaca]
MNWRRVDVAYHDPELDHLILAARPLLGEASGRCWFQRHWVCGPHLEWWFDGARPTWDRVREVLEAALRARPSRVRIDQDRLLAQHRHLAAAERIDEPLLPFYEDNTVHRAVPRSRAHVLGGVAAEELFHDFHSAASVAAFDQLDAVAAGESRLALAFELMVAAAHAYAEGGIAGGFVSFRSHAEAFLASTAQPGTVRERWDAQYASRAGELRARVADVVAGTPRGRAWAELLDGFAGRGDELIASGALVVEPASPDAVAEPDSEFHRALRGNRAWQEEVLRSASFRRYRLLLNLTYLQLSRLGVTAVQRSLLCHFAASAVEQEYEVSAIEIATGGT